MILLKNDLLKGYKVGDTLEKTVYDDKRAPINVDTWCGEMCIRDRDYTEDCNRPTVLEDYLGNVVLCSVIDGSLVFCLPHRPQL